MKKSVAISTIIAFHALVIGVLLFQAGCSSEPETKPTSAKSTVEEIAPTNEEKTQIEEAKKEEAKAEVLPPEGSNVLRVPPTRPTWQMGGAKQEEIVVEDKKPETTEVVKPSEPPVVKPKTTDANLITYKVQKGDSLAKIAKKNKVSLNKILEINGMDRSSVIRVGQEISLPAPEPTAEVVPAVPTAPKTESTNVETEELTTYIVKKGDYLGKIARKYKMSVKQLMAINNLKNHNIRIGQKLNVSKSATSTTATPVAPETKAEVKLAEGEVLHVVKSGETLGAIALKYGTSVKAIMEKNSIKDARKLRVGQKLTIVSRKAVKQESAKLVSAPVEKPKPVAVEKPTTQEQQVPAPPVVVTPEPAPTSAPTTTTAEPVQTVSPVAPVQNTNPPVIEL